MGIFSLVESFYNDFNGEKTVIGNSIKGKPLYLFKVKKSDFPKVIFQYSMHAREYVTALVALKHIEHFACYGCVGTAYFIPLMNPDGVEISENSRPLYKSNGRGVDLNVNFDARWGKGKSNVKVLGDENYIGEYPFSEPETKALRDFTLFICPDMTVSYHSKGEEIYWEFFQKGKIRDRDYRIAKAVERETGYAIKGTPDSCGGYKDWCVQKLKIPAITLEVGSDDLAHPIKAEQADYIFDKTKGVANAVMRALVEEKWT